MSTSLEDQLVDKIRGLDDEARVAVDAFVSMLEDVRATVPAPDLPGLPAVSEADLAGAVARNEARLWEERDRLYAGALSRDEAAKRAGVGANQITNLLRDGDLLAIDGSHGLRLPAWQFHPDARRGRLEGIREVVAAFPGGLLWLSSWVVAPDPILNGRAPQQALLNGDVSLVVAAAQTVGQ